jgi:hypothetical protein
LIKKGAAALIVSNKQISWEQSFAASWFATPTKEDI